MELLSSHLAEVTMTGNAEQIIKWLFTQERDKVFDIDVHREKRSLNANSYFHVLCQKIAEAKSQIQDIPITKDDVKRDLIQTFGAFERDENGNPKWIVLPKNEPIPNDLYLWDMNADVDITGKNSGEQMGRAYFIIKHSHMYNTKEMAELIDGAIRNAKELDIDTITPAELERMIGSWKGVVDG